MGVWLPKFKDTHTELRPVQGTPEEAEQAEGLDHVYMDAMAFGMGCCCLQVSSRVL